MEQFVRTAMLLGSGGLARLAKARVAVFGLGGVGGHAAEALVRSGIGAIDLIDRDRVALSNLNRQLIATRATVDMLKTEAMTQRLREINPEARITGHPMFYLPETADLLDLRCFDYVLDAVDTVSAKLTLAQRAAEAGTPIISAMGAGNKLDPTLLRVADISETTVDPLARVMRRELRRRGIGRLKVVYSTEPAMTPDAGEGADGQGEPGRRATPGSVAFVPSVMGLIMAGEVVKDIALNRLNRPLRAEEAT